MEQLVLKRSALGAAVLMATPGIPMLFQGQELLEDGYFNDWDPLDWAKAETNQGIVKLYSGSHTTSQP